jgi:hypothetical protein
MSVDDFLIYSYNVGSIGKDVLSFGFRSMHFMSKCEKKLLDTIQIISELFLRNKLGQRYSIRSLLINPKNLGR